MEITVNGIVVGTHITFTGTILQVKRIIVQSDVKQVIGQTTVVNQGDGILGSQRTVAEMSIGTGRLSHSVPVLLLHLHLHPGDRTGIGITGMSQRHGNGKTK